MKDFETYELRHVRSEHVELARAVHALPDFAWQGGDSDAQGPYIVGTSNDQIVIKLWLGEKPALLTVSFRSAVLRGSDLETRKRHVLESIEQAWIPPVKRSKAAEAGVAAAPDVAVERQGMA